MGCAAKGLFAPRWSNRILEEWSRAARKLGAKQEALAHGEVARLRAAWPMAEVPAAPNLEARLWLPDANDVHVLAAGVAGSCDAIVTMNSKDFPKNLLAEEGLDRLDPDGFLLSLFGRAPDDVSDVVLSVVGVAEQLSGLAWGPRKLMKKARLNRLGKAVELHL